MQNIDIARIFDELANLLEIQGANPFRIRAYRNASRTLENMSESVSGIVDDGSQNLQDWDGIGKELAAKITTIVQTGELPQLEELKQEIPDGVVQMLRLPGLGPKKVAALYKELQIESLDELQKAAETGEIAKLKGFGKKTEQTILENIERVKVASSRTHIHLAKQAADAIVSDLLELSSVSQASVAGSCRRRQETVGDLDILVTASDSKEPMDLLEEHASVETVLQRGDTKQRVRLRMGLELDLRVVPEESYGAALQYFTGSKEHNIVLRRRAQERGLKLNEYGLFRDENPIAGASEEEIYKALDLQWVPPELRENRGEIELAEDHRLSELLDLKDIRGDLHMHTTASDGQNSIREMADAAKQLGWKYIAITDHSKRVSVANGLDANQLRKHWIEIEKVNEEVKGIEILKGVECDILEDATLDLDDEVLSEADIVIAVLHYGLNQPADQIQKRLIHAVRNPYVHCIGHPSGRHILKREGAKIDYPDLFKAAADHGVMMEINASPMRLDLTDIQAAAAKEFGIPIVINTDSHQTSGFAKMQYGVFQARRAGLEKKDVANTKTLKQFQRLLRK